MLVEERLSIFILQKLLRCRLLFQVLKNRNTLLDFVNQVDKSKVAVQKALEQTQTLFDSLMQKYFG